MVSANACDMEGDEVARAEGLNGDSEGVPHACPLAKRSRIVPQSVGTWAGHTAHGMAES